MTDDAGSVPEAVTRRREQALSSWLDLATALTDPALVGAVDAAGVAVASALRSGRTLLVAGNGGSAAMASHVAAEFLGKCIQDRAPLPAISLAESTASMSAIGNDYGFDQVFERGVRAFGHPGDVLVVMSTSGSSANVLAALDSAAQLGLVTVALTGARGEGLDGRADHVLKVPSTSTPRIQEVHLLWTHMWCEAVDILAHESSAGH